MPHLSRTVKLVGAFAAVAVLSGGVAVAASPALRSEPKNPRIPAINASGVTTQAGYVALAPCRIVDTRKAGGPISGGFSRPFAVGGTTGFTGQGGGTSTGCGVPVGASTVALAVTTTQSAAGKGYLTFYADGSSRPLANQTSYTQGQNVTTLVNAPLNTGNGRVDVYALHTTHVIIDVAGYYREPIAVSVGASGSIIAKSGQVTGVTHVSTGNYEISFAQNIAGCAAVGSSTTSYNNVGVFTDSSTSLRVYVRDITVSPTAYADDVFAVTVTC